MDVQIVEDVRFAQQGDCEAFIRLISGIERSLYGVARSMLRRDEDCADAIQEAILKAFRAIHTLREPAFFRTWMFRIVINECRQIMSKQKRIVVVAELPALSSPASDYENIEYLDLVAAIDRLEELHRIVITLHYFEDMTIKDIADLLDTTEGTVKSRLYRARAALGKYIDNPYERKNDYETC
ncbi:sigma-70 family RNA polymerase sigma factor [Paenibacillus apiarius]|uniref:sigma-70 family RNA polymerase sigma factor n=1 Tax=Paenibacillus apiarius TaxID=46240 RepID=UPI003B3B9018